MRLELDLDTPARRLRGARTCLIIGSADCAWSDIEIADAYGIYERVIVLNRMGVDYPHRIDSWVIGGSAEETREWTAARERRHGKTDHVVMHRWDIERGGGALLGIQVALQAGVEKIVLAGCPLESKQAHYYDPKPWTDADDLRGAWVKFFEEQPDAKPRVRSCSGWTYLHLGAPSMRWWSS